MKSKRQDLTPSSSDLTPSVIPYLLILSNLGSIISSIIGLIVMIYVLPTIHFSLEDPELMKQTLLDNQYLQMSRIINTLFLLWSANIWIFGIKYARNLSTWNAAITVSIPVGIYLLYSLYIAHLI